jgi:D-glycero-D-manno-heptose 1,7-bisphosphate phosphatase
MNVDIFLDRDGTLIKDSGYISDPNGIIFLEGVLEKLFELKSCGFRLHLVSNQSGVGRGIISRSQFESVDLEFRNLLLRNKIILDSVHYCLHAPSEICECRKPKLLLFSKVESDFNLIKQYSGMIGNSESDRESASNFGIEYWNIDERDPLSFIKASNSLRSHFERIPLGNQ